MCSSKGAWSGLQQACQASGQVQHMQLLAFIAAAEQKQTGHSMNAALPPQLNNTAVCAVTMPMLLLLLLKVYYYFYQTPTSCCQQHPIPIPLHTLPTTAEQR
jgi:hypothetical protein